ncbi:HAD family hydrolase [Vibrio spartinae]|uniref:Putative HAD-hydrolase YfnB n=1 Tax=Vibrio spartinae TaxID=1918945 RepID=A0A1N6M235_9VIBR|nr:HAD family hydrolase [Vibrio spartinae]SIO93472.1 Putative HAD-hydrolase YfnB [Vibrio spartinae]
MTIKKLIFDLDDTLINHSFAEKRTLIDIFQSNNNSDLSFEEFVTKTKVRSSDLWSHFEQGKLNIDSVLNLRSEYVSQLIHLPFNETHKLYIDCYLNNSHTYSGSDHLLETLRESYSLSLCTNGKEEIQVAKMKKNNMHHFFDSFYYGTEYPFNKPNRYLFEKILRNESLKANEVIMIGDSLKNDILTPQNLGMKTIYIDRNKFFSDGKLKWKNIVQEVEKLA